jgi:hypothetical protein
MLVCDLLPYASKEHAPAQELIVLIWGLGEY